MTLTTRQIDLIYKLIIVFSLEFVVFFAWEIFIPGVVMGVLNINLILLAILILVSFLLLGSKKEDNVDVFEKLKGIWWRRIIVVILSLLFIFILRKTKLVIVYVPMIYFITKFLKSKF